MLRTNANKDSFEKQQNCKKCEHSIHCRNNIKEWKENSLSDIADTSQTIEPRLKPISVLSVKDNHKDMIEILSVYSQTALQQETPF